ncbi:hypothetical protein CRYUN_Cryun05aG0254300 [Craigia yunnanensis]
MESVVPFAGILSRHPSHNPDFYNWNIVKIRYCDGASLAGHPESEFKDATVKCLADAGFFLDEPDVLGNHTMCAFYRDVVELEGVAKSLHKNCVKRMEPSKAGDRSHPYRKDRWRLHFYVHGQPSRAEYRYNSRHGWLRHGIRPILQESTIRFNKLVAEVICQSSRFERQFLRAMRKHMRHKSASISIPHGHPGCMWGVLHVLKYQRWHWRFIKKRLPHKKHDVGAENAGDRIQASDADDWSEYRKAEVANSKERRESSPATKNSVKSRLKALITEEVSKRKGRGRHHRSSTYPARSQLTRTGSVHHAEAHIDDLLPEIALNDESLTVADENNEISSDSSSEDKSLPKSSEEPINSDENDEECGMMSDVCFHGQKSPHHESTEDIRRKSMPLIAADHRADGIHKLNQAKPEMADISSSGSSQHLKQSIGYKVAKKRFKHLKQNIKHAIKESKKERHRIAMDAVLHKIPHKKGFSKDLTKDIFYHFKNPSRIRDVFSEFSTSKRRMQHERRASSFNESMDRYTQSYESSINREAKENISKRIQERGEEEMVLPRRSAPKSLGRILSSPELHSYFYQSEDSSDAFSSDMPTTLADTTLCVSSLTEQKILDVLEALDFRSQDTLGKSASEGNMIGIRETLDDSGNLMIGDNVSQSEQDSKPGIIPITKLEEPSPIPLLNFRFECQTASPAEISKSQEAELELKQSPGLPNELDFLADVQHELRDTPKVAEGIVEFEKVEALKKDLDTDLLKDRVETNDKDKFTYVRDVLELSGFSGNETLGTWYADDQPLDPLLYEAIRGCTFCDPHCSGDEEISYCNHPPLFDLINEVLMELYERSYSYCPRLLSSLCHIRQMPVGHRVLKEVWANISWYLSFESGFDKPLDYVTCRDLTRSDGWMNLQFENECLGLELEELIFEDLLEELI